MVRAEAVKMPSKIMDILCVRLRLDLEGTIRHSVSKVHLGKLTMETAAAYESGQNQNQIK